MIISFIHKGIEDFFRTGNKKGIHPAHARKLQFQLTALDSSATLSDMDIPGWGLHQLQGSRKNIWSISVNGNWRLTFKFSQGNVELLNYEDCH